VTSGKRRFRAGFRRSIVTSPMRSPDNQQPVFVFMPGKEWCPAFELSR
jgi:hypothetical protein